LISKELRTPLFRFGITAKLNGIGHTDDSGQCLNVSPAGDSSVKRTGYIGDAACLSCHKEQGLSYHRTSHHLTLQPAGKDSILGSLADGLNILMISNPETTNPDPRLYFKMEVMDDGQYQTAVAERGSQRLTQSKLIDIVIGSGVRGQTYLYWAGDQLYELPVSYWSLATGGLIAPTIKTAQQTSPAMLTRGAWNVMRHTSRHSPPILRQTSTTKQVW
jgi:hypothetical protein